MSWNLERAAALRAVESACRLCETVRAELVTAVDKSDRSPVTVADYGAQALVSLALAEATPDVPLVGEESAEALRSGEAQALRPQVIEQVRRLRAGISEDEILDAIDAGNDPGGARGRRWVLDPIDGTKGFLRNDQYAVALALLEDGKPVLGVLGCPALPPTSGDGPRGALFAAVRGEGTEQLSLDGSSPRSVHVATLDDPSRASFCESVETAHSDHDVHARIAERLGVTAPPVRMDSQCKYAAVARGQASIYLRLPKSADYVEKIWDHAAGAMVVEEAGGRVTDATGAPLDFSRGRTLERNRGVVATNGSLHDEVIAAIGAVVDL